MSSTDTTVVRILAYVRAQYASEKFAAFLKTVNSKDQTAPDGLLGFSCDVTVEVETDINGYKFVALIDHYGDGQLYEDLEDARRRILAMSGVLCASGEHA